MYACGIAAEGSEGVCVLCVCAVCVCARARVCVRACVCVCVCVTYTPGYVDRSTKCKNRMTCFELKFELLFYSVELQNKSIQNTVRKPSPVKICLKHILSFIGNQRKVAHCDWRQ